MTPEQTSLIAAAKRLLKIREQIGCITVLDLQDAAHLKLIDDAWMFLVPYVCDGVVALAAQEETP